MEFITRFLKAHRQSFFLFGPRGTGKSWWVKATAKDCLYIDLMNPETYRIYLSTPELLLETLDGSENINQVVIDEIQKVPQVLDSVQVAMEKNKKLQFILTGSSSRKLKRAGVNLLAGRALLQFMHPFIASELGRKFSIQEALKFGMLPLVWFSEDKNMTLKAYHALYLKEEVQQEALVRNIANFARFLEAITFSHGSTLNLTNVARECLVERKTVEGYLSILEDLLLSFRVPVFSRKAKRKLISHEKFYFFDCGIYRSLRPYGSYEVAEEINGPALEGLVIQHLKAWIEYRGKNNDLYYWRTPSGVEVDAVIYGEDGLWAIEVKHSRKVKPKDIKALLTFKEDYPQATLLLLYMGKTRLKIKNVLCLPCEEFLRSVHPDTLPGKDY